MEKKMSEEVRILKADGFDNAVIGTSVLGSRGETVIVYDYSKCVEILMFRDGMTDEEAIEYMDFNVVGAYMGEGTPIFMCPRTLAEIEEHIADPIKVWFNDEE